MTSGMESDMTSDSTLDMILYVTSEMTKDMTTEMTTDMTSDKCLKFCTGSNIFCSNFEADHFSIILGHTNLSLEYLGDNIISLGTRY